MTAHESLMSAVSAVLENYYVLEFDQDNITDQVVWVEREKMQTLSRAYGEFWLWPTSALRFGTTKKFAGNFRRGIGRSASREKRVSGDQERAQAGLFCERLALVPGASQPAPAH
jgi:hypothetical protein